MPKKEILQFGKDEEAEIRQMAHDEARAVVAVLIGPLKQHLVDYVDNHIEAIKVDIVKQCTAALRDGMDEIATAIRGKIFQ